MITTKVVQANWTQTYRPGQYKTCIEIEVSRISGFSRGDFITYDLKNGVKLQIHNVINKTLETYVCSAMPEEYYPEEFLRLGQTLIKDSHGHIRCRNCQRFMSISSLKKPHTCKETTRTGKIYVDGITCTI